MKKILSLVLSLMLLFSMAAIPAAAEEYREPITLTMFSQLANFAGEQTGCDAAQAAAVAGQRVVADAPGAAFGAGADRPDRHDVHGV